MCNFACLVALGVLNVTNSAVSFYIHSPNSNFDFARCMSFLIETHLHDCVHYQFGQFCIFARCVPCCLIRTVICFVLIFVGRPMHTTDLHSCAIVFPHVWLKVASFVFRN